MPHFTSGIVIELDSLGQLKCANQREDRLEFVLFLVNHYRVEELQNTAFLTNGCVMKVSFESSERR